MEFISKPEEGSHRAPRRINYSGIKIREIVKYNAGRGYFRFGYDNFKIHWIGAAVPI